MKIRESGACDFCGKNLAGEAYEETHTRSDYDFCCYECFESFFGGEIAEDDDFLIVPE